MTEHRANKILVVDDEPVNLQVLRQILKDRYDLVFARNGVEALAAVRKHQPDLVLLDVMMPEMDGRDTLRRLRAEYDQTKMPVIFVTAMGDEDDEELGFDLGAVDYIKKPVKPKVVRARVATHLTLARQQIVCDNTVLERTRALNQSQTAAIYMLAQAGHFNDPDTGVHIWRMAAYSAALAKAALWTVEDVKTLELAATMHDTGKIGIADAILKKPARLSEAEMEIMRTHTNMGHDILSRHESPLFQMAADIAFYHHEWWNGQGYPRGIAGEDIPECARVVAVADVFDALTMKRPYKEAWPVEKAFAYVKEGSGSQFDPGLVELAMSLEPAFIGIMEHWRAREHDGDGHAAYHHEMS